MSGMNVSLLIQFLTKGADKVRNEVGGIRKQFQELRTGFSGAIRQGFSESNIDTALNNAEQLLTRARGRLMDAVGMAVALGAPVRAAMQFEEAFADLEKVLDAPARKLGEIRQGLIGMSREIALSSTGLTTIMASAAQAGIPTQELERFTKATARAAVAFDMTAGEIGTRFAKLRNVYKLNQNQLELYADSANHLSNNMAATAAEITNFANRAAGAQRTLRLTAVEMNAVGAAMVAAGIMPETAARGLSALANRLAQGSNKAKSALKTAGLSYRGFMASLEDDAPAALSDLFDRLSKSPDGMKALIDLVGQDFSDDFSKLLNNPDLLRQAFELVGNEADYAGSALEEYEKRAETTQNKLELLRNRLAALAIVLGDQLLEPLGHAVEGLGGLIDRVSAFAERQPELTEAIVQGTGALLAFGIASRLVGYAHALIAGPLIKLISLFWRFSESGRNVSMLARSLRGLRSAGRGFGWLAAQAGLFLASFGPNRVKSALAGLRMLSTFGKGAAIGAVFAGLKTAATTALAAISAAAWPVTAAIAALAAAAFFVWKYWERLSTAVSGFFQGLGEAFAPEIEAVKAAWNGFVDSVAARAREMAEAIGINVDRVAEYFARMFDFSGLIEGLSKAKQAVADFFGSLFTQENLSAGDAAGIEAAGKRIGERLGNAIKATLRAFVGFGTAIVDAILEGLQGSWQRLSTWVQAQVDALKAMLKFDWPFGGGGEETQSDVAAIREKNGLAAGASVSPFPSPPPEPIPPLQNYLDSLPPAKVEQEISASVTDKRPPQVNVTVNQSISGVVDPVAAGRAANAGIEAAVRRGRTGALHDGTE
ncbi:phage tail tape measure protein [Stappia stellulata]|uniref:phage tail tape measure protein n=1 Tax=Stappia stellulata TaxID=71235 RepID=UPI001CD67638|nr:phage tail tape measure protein [Stappia stellulata]MCA1242933.1 phage tail tape measure protein [Stappia stellulata]